MEMSAKGPLPAAAESLFQQADWDAIQNLLDRLDDRQRYWLSGFLAGGALPAEAAAPAAEDASSPLLIAYGTETGNCKALAQRLYERCQERGIPARVADLAQTKARQLQKESML